METFETWLLRRVAQAVEAGEVPEALLMELQAEIEAANILVSTMRLPLTSHDEPLTRIMSS